MSLNPRGKKYFFKEWKLFNFIKGFKEVKNKIENMLSDIITKKITIGGHRKISITVSNQHHTFNFDYDQYDSNTLPSEEKTDTKKRKNENIF